ncbi:hypothetical protein [Mycolicibacter sinensis]
MQPVVASEPKSVPERRALVVTWNPDKFQWGDGYAEAVKATSRGRDVINDWSTGNRTGGVDRGDRVFLLRQGVQGGRGIIASGTILGSVTPAAHWDGSGRIANYIRAAWECVVGAENALATDVLEERLSGQHWRPQGGGILIKSEVVGALERLWSDHLARVIQNTRPAGRGQHLLTDAERRLKVEDAAQARLMEYYRREGWTVSDTRHGNPFDAVAQRGDDFLYLEAKGTQSRGAGVLVTRGEVEHARVNNGLCVMGIWSGIGFDDDGEVDPSSGQFRIVPFSPDDGDLTGLTFEWSVPGAAEVPPPEQ